MTKEQVIPQVIFGLLACCGILGLVIAVDQGRAQDGPSRFVARMLGYSSAYMLWFALMALRLVL